MKRVLAVAFLALIVAPLAGPGAQAQGPHSAAGDCRAMSEIYGPDGVWWGRFSGGRKARNSFRDNGGVEYHTAELCFAARATCEAWLYRLKSDWQFMPRYNECSKGYEPGRSLRRSY